MECSSREVEELLTEFISKHTDSKLLIGVSGGMDSMLLLHFMVRLGWQKRCIVAHVNYRLRGENSDADADMVKRYCLENQLLFTEKRVTDAERESLYEGNLQQVARDLRFAFFKKIKEEFAADLVVLAHHADDQEETFWLRLIRGAGPHGLAGMKAFSNGVWRPFLPFRKSELEQLAKTVNLRWREDESNQTMKYNRNRFRLELLPFLKKEIPSLSDSVLHLQKLFQTQNEEDEIVASHLCKQFINKKIVSLSTLKNLTENQLVMFFHTLQIPTGKIQDFKKLYSAEKGAVLTWKDREGKQKNLFREKNGMALEQILTDDDFQFSITEVEELPADFNVNTFFFDASKIKGDLKIRQWEEGDVIFPIGVNGSKLVSKFLKDKGVRTSVKRQVRVLVDDEMVLACPFLGMDRRKMALTSSTLILEVKFVKGTKSVYSPSFLDN